VWQRKKKPPPKANEEFNNPLTQATLFIVENDYVTANGNITTNDVHANVTIIEPVIPISLGASGWSMINRPILPIITDAELPVAGSAGGGVEGGSGLVFDEKTAIGDFSFFSAFSPEKKTGPVIWGAGPMFRFPTATNDALGAEKWSAGPMAVVNYAKDNYSMGFLNTNLFSFAGDDSRKDVKVSTLQYFAFYNFTPK
jgi:hypothetical protein